MIWDVLLAKNKQTKKPPKPTKNPTQNEATPQTIHNPQDPSGQNPTGFVYPVDPERLKSDCFQGCYLFCIAQISIASYQIIESKW